MAANTTPQTALPALKASPAAEFLIGAINHEPHAHERCCIRNSILAVAEGAKPTAYFKFNPKGSVPVLGSALNGQYQLVEVASVTAGKRFARFANLAACRSLFIEHEPLIRDKMGPRKDRSELFAECLDAVQPTTLPNNAFARGIFLGYPLAEAFTYEQERRHIEDFVSLAGGLPGTVNELREIRALIPNSRFFLLKGCIPDDLFAEYDHTFFSDVRGPCSTFFGTDIPFPNFAWYGDTDSLELYRRQIGAMCNRFEQYRTDQDLIRALSIVG